MGTLVVKMSTRIVIIIRVDWGRFYFKLPQEIVSRIFSSYNVRNSHGNEKYLEEMKQVRKRKLA